jgi:hypothetical protein
MRLPLLPVLVFAALCGLAHAHPLPEIPIHASFDGQGGLSLRTEVDPRCFEPDPNVAPSVTKADFALTPAAQQDAVEDAGQRIHAEDRALPPRWGSPLEPVFEWTFTTHENVPLKSDDDVVVLTGTASVKIPARRHRLLDRGDEGRQPQRHPAQCGARHGFGALSGALSHLKRATSSISRPGSLARRRPLSSWRRTKNPSRSPRPPPRHPPTPKTTGACF